MKTTMQTARRRLRDSNPVPQEAFSNAARDSLGQQAFADILASPIEPVPARPRLRWQIAAPVAAAAAGVVVAVSLISAPPRGAVPLNGSLASLAADLTYHPPARPGDDAAAVLRRLAGVAAAQPSPALGPVEYVKSVSWGLDLGTIHYGLSYRSHELSTQELWYGRDGASLRVLSWPDGKTPPGVVSVIRTGAGEQGKGWHWYNPATLPVDLGALRKHLLNMPKLGLGSRPDEAQTIVSNALRFMSVVSLPSAVRGSLLRLMADEAAARVSDARLINVGTVTDRAGHTGIAIGYEIPAGFPPPVSLQVLIFDPGTAALLGEEFAYCKGKLGTQPTDGQCFATSYDQILQITAVPTIPASPPATNPSASPAPTAVDSPTP